MEKKTLKSQTSVEEIRQKTRDLFIQETRKPGSMISPETAAAFLNCSYLTIYRWLNNPTWLPSPDQCKILLQFIEIVKETRAGWAEFLDVWEGRGLKASPDSIRLTLYEPKLLRVIRSEKFNKAEKIEELTIRSLRLLKTKAEAEEAK